MNLSALNNQSSSYQHSNQCIKFKNSLKCHNQRNYLQEHLLAVSDTARTSGSAAIPNIVQIGKRKSCRLRSIGVTYYL